MKIRPLTAIAQFELLHRLKSGAPSDAACMAAENKPAFVLSTCLRDLALLPGSGVSQLPEESSSRLERLCGAEAYKLLLEVLCGLHSPLVGETEVFGQFKAAVKDFEAQWQQSQMNDVALLAGYRSWFQALIEDTKRIRAQFLQEQGSQSYGSLVRRLVREWNSRSVVLVGSGQLVQEIAPWLSKSGSRGGSSQQNVKLHLLARSMDRAHELAAKLASRDSHFQVEVLKFESESTPSTALSLGDELTVIVCAPIEAKRLVKYPGFQNARLSWIDLRAESGIDDLNTKSFQHGLQVERAMILKDFFELVESSKQRAESLKARANEAIRELVRLRTETSPLSRPWSLELARRSS